jgi:hypothetical protein
MKKVLHITERKRETNIKHYRQANDFRAGFEVAEWRMFCHQARLQSRPARFKQVYSDSAVPPKPDRFMAYIYTPFMKKVLHITERKRKTNIQHDCKSDDFRAGFEVAKWRVFCHSA